MSDLSVTWNIYSLGLQIFAQNINTMNAKEANKQVVHKLTSDQLSVATKLRSIANKFSKEGELEMQKHDALNIHVYETLKSLANDESIIITKPDKGRGVVIMNKSDYINKMELLSLTQNR